MDKDEVIIKVKKYADKVNQRIKLNKVVLYGSFAKGNWHEGDEDILETEKVLFRLRRGIDDRIEPVLLEEHSDKSGFLKDVLKPGQVVYSR